MSNSIREGCQQVFGFTKKFQKKETIPVEECVRFFIGDGAQKIDEKWPFITSGFTKYIESTPESFDPTRFKLEFIAATLGCEVQAVRNIWDKSCYDMVINISGTVLEEFINGEDRAKSTADSFRFYANEWISLVGDPGAYLFGDNPFAHIALRMLEQNQFHIAVEKTDPGDVNIIACYILGEQMMTLRNPVWKNLSTNYNVTFG